MSQYLALTTTLSCRRLHHATPALRRGRGDDAPPRLLRPHRPGRVLRGHLHHLRVRPDPTATTGIQIENALGGGLSATVESERYGDYGADMAPGACEVWGFPAGAYGVALQRCEQGEAGSTKCTRLLGTEVRRTVTVGQGARTRLRVDPGFFGGS